MRRHATAPSAESTSGNGGSRVRFGRAFATRGASDDAKGSGAPSHRYPFAAALVLFALLALLVAPAADAGKVPGFGVLGTGATGTGAGQLGATPKGVAVNTTGAGGVTAGDVYVSDATNNRISEYHAGGEFVRTFGQNVVTSGPDNVTPTNATQSVEVPNTVTGGTFRLAFNGATTGGTATGTLTEGSNGVTSLLTAKGTGTYLPGAFTITAVTTSVGEFLVGQPIAGAGIPAGAKVTSVSGSTLTISAATTAEGNNAELTSAGPLPFTVGEAVSGSGIPAGTTVTATGAGTLTLSAPVEAGHSGTGVALTANLPYNATATTVQTALQALGTIGASNATVTGGPGATAPYAVTFAGALKEAPLPLIVANSSGLSGGSVTVTNTTTGVSPYEICNVAANPTDVCQAGTSSSTAGGIAGAQGLAVDPATGNVFLVSETSHRINVYSATGAFEGAFGWKVNATAPGETLQFCTVTSGCAAGSTGAGAGQFGTMTGQAQAGAAPTMDTVNGHLLVPEPGNRRLDEFSLTLSSNTVTGAAFVKAVGADVRPTINEKQTVTLSGASGGTFALIQEGKSTNAAGSGNVETGSNEISGLKVTEGAFAVGDEAFGPGIPAGARITAVTFDSLTLTASATQTTPSAAVTAALPYNAAASVVQAALRGLSSIGSGNAAVTGAAGGPYTVEFTGALAGVNVPQLSADGTGLTGASPAVAVATVQTGANGSSTGFESCTTASTCKAGGGEVTGSFGGEFGAFPTSSLTSVAVDSTGSVYATGQAQFCDGFGCRVQKFKPDLTSPEAFAPGLFTPTINNAPAFSPRFVAVDPSNDHVLVVKKVTTTTSRIYEVTKTGTLLEISPPTEEGLTGSPTGGTNGPQGFAVGTGGRAYYAMVGAGASTPVKILSEPQAAKASIDPPSALTEHTATLVGIATPAPAGAEGGFPSVAFFEYSTDGVTWQSTPQTEIGTGTGAGSPNSCPTGNPPTCNLSQTVAGLKAGTTYLARLVVLNGSRATSATTQFTTVGAAPGIVGLGASQVTQTSASFVGEIEPNGQSTSYHFEWGPTTAYGTRVPADFEAVAGGGSAPIPVSIEVSGLQPGTTYHFRIVAKSAAGTAVSEDRAVTTLTVQGLPAKRGYELVSPANKRPVGSAVPVLGVQAEFGMAEEGGGIAYPLLNGLEDGTSGGEIIFDATRGEGGWDSAPITPPAIIPAPKNEPRTGWVWGFSRNLACAVVQSFNPLSADTPQVDVENGVENLYLWNRASGSYTLLTNRVPSNPSASSFPLFGVDGVNNDCTKVFFSSNAYVYLPGASGLYEWDEGVLRDAGLRPDGSVAPGIKKEEVAVTPYTVSRNSRLFFMATSNEAADNGKLAVFVRKGPGQVVDASKPTNGPTTGATYEAASPDGKRVFFLSNYGIASTSSSGPTGESCDATGASGLAGSGNNACDLYEYNVETGALTDVSANSSPANTKGAVVLGVLDVSEDGTTVYFAARGQLVPGEGRTYAQNLNTDTGYASVYRYHAGKTSYVGPIAMKDAERHLEAQEVLTLDRRSWTAQTTKSGDYLLFPSTANVTGANPGFHGQIYLYSAATGETECISCPRGRQVTKEAELANHATNDNPNAPSGSPSSLSEDGRVVFMSGDQLAPGAVPGDNQVSYGAATHTTNVYEWYEGQTSLLFAGKGQFLGMGGDEGTDVYIRAFEQLLPEDTDFSSDIYDLRIGSPGFAQPAVEEPCDPAADQCQGAPSPPPAAQGPASAAFSGPGNPPAAKPKPKKCGKGQVRRKGKCVKKGKKPKKKAKAHKRAANANRGGAK